MKNTIYAILLLMPVFAIGMTKDGTQPAPPNPPYELVLDPDAPFTPQVFKLFGVHQALQHSYKTKKNRKELRFLASCLYGDHTFIERCKEWQERIKPHDINTMSPTRRAELAWNYIIDPIIISIAVRNDWIPQLTDNVRNNFYQIFSQVRTKKENK